MRPFSKNKLTMHRIEQATAILVTLLQSSSSICSLYYFSQKKERRTSCCHRRVSEINLLGTSPHSFWNASFFAQKPTQVGAMVAQNLLNYNAFCQKASHNRTQVGQVLAQSLLNWQPFTVGWVSFWAEISIVEQVYERLFP